MCLFVLNRNPNPWTDPDEIGPEVVLEGGRFGGGGLTQYPPPPGMGCKKGVWGASGASTVRFGENSIKRKL